MTSDNYDPNRKLAFKLRRRPSRELTIGVALVAAALVAIGALLWGVGI